MDSTLIRLMEELQKALTACEVDTSMLCDDAKGPEIRFVDEMGILFTAARVEWDSDNNFVVVNLLEDEEE